MKPLDEPSLDLIGRWKFPDHKFVCEKLVLLKQTNLIGNTYFSNYIEWQGEARERLLLSHPATEGFLKQNPHIKLITHSLYHRFLQDTSLADTIRIELTTREILDYSLVIVFRYNNTKTNAFIGEGWQKICFFDTRLKRLCPVPQFILDLAEPIREDPQK